MILFEGYMGRILHTGDMRFNIDLLDSLPVLFPPDIRTENLAKCSI